MGRNKFGLDEDAIVYLVDMDGETVAIAVWYVRSQTTRTQLAEAEAIVDFDPDRTLSREGDPPKSAPSNTRDRSPLGVFRPHRLSDDKNGPFRRHAF